MLTTTTTLGLAIATTVRMIVGIAANATSQRTTSQVPSTSRFAQHDVFMLAIPDFPDRCLAFSMKATNLT